MDDNEVYASECIETYSKEYAHENIQTNLAISLHAPNNEIRDRIMKINKAYKIEELIDAIKYYINETNRRVTILKYRE